MGAVRRVEAGAARLDRCDGRLLPVFACGGDDEVARAFVVAWKDGGRHDVDRLVAAALLRSGAHVARCLLGAGVGAVTVVPVPSSPGAARRRGRAMDAVLARWLAEALTVAGVSAAPAVVLRRARSAGDQRRLGAGQRAANMAGGITVGRPVVGPVVLVDDVMTTGSSLAACEAALTRTGAIVAAAVVITATSPGSLLAMSDEGVSSR